MPYIEVSNILLAWQSSAISFSLLNLEFPVFPLTVPWCHLLWLLPLSYHWLNGIWKGFPCHYVGEMHPPFPYTEHRVETQEWRGLHLRGKDYCKPHQVWWMWHWSPSHSGIFKQHGSPLCCMHVLDCSVPWKKLALSTVVWVAHLFSTSSLCDRYWLPCYVTYLSNYGLCDDHYQVEKCNLRNYCGCVSGCSSIGFFCGGLQSVCTLCWYSMKFSWG